MTETITPEQYRAIIGQQPVELATLEMETDTDLVLSLEERDALFMPKPSKYKNVKTEVDGITFDSKAEARRYGELRLMTRAGEIHGIFFQPRFPLVVNNVKIGTYVADFSYVKAESGDGVVEDVKGVKTPVYRLKKKLVKALYGIEIVEVTT